MLRLCLVTAFTFALITGCGKKSDSPPTSRIGDKPETLESKNRTAVVPKTGVVRSSDDLGEWDTERISQNVDKQLKRLGKILIHWSEEGDSNQFADICSDNIMSFPFCPRSTEVVYDDKRRLRIARAQVDSQPSDTPNKGRDSFAKAINAMLQDSSPISEGRFKFKIFHVGLMPNDEAAVHAYFQFYAKSKNHWLQVNATWKMIWERASQADPKLLSLQITQYDEIVDSNDTQFVDSTDHVFGGRAFDEQFRMGVDHWLHRIESRHGIDIGGWQGIAIGDVNGDGMDDVYACAPGGLPNRLFVQNADGSTTEISAESGVDWIDSTHGALIVDFDNDGDQDLAVGVESGILLMSNDGTGKFTLRSAKVMPAAIPYSLSAADYDLDGDLDLFVCCYNRRQGVNRHLLFARPVPYHDANNGGRNVLLKNENTSGNGDWQFRYATGRSRLDQNNRRFSYAAAWEDFDDDGDLDIYVANDFGRNNFYRNDRGLFTDIAPQTNLEDIGPGMSTCWGDIDNDGKSDLYVSNMFSSAGNRITGQAKFHASADQRTKDEFRKHARGNSLFHNLGDGRFEEISDRAGVALGRWAWGAKFADLNNDGQQDLIVANGFITQPDTGDL